ncbi:sucrase ferredoxin [Chroococcidiopsis sp. CCMEE 29]|uniref:sucrase ferredoxin n=1 Tax=Chroococcidiopsis sp. CCMEE 29 TaxID=155894 RepID=UPI0031F7A06D
MNLQRKNQVGKLSKSDNFSKKLGLSNCYSKQEFHVPDITQAAPLVKDYLAGNPLNVAPVEGPTRDILVCTHGSHDKCCAKYGNPFYRQALATVSDLSLSQVRVWQASHIGGHRFAPTAIDFPEGRYYGYLDSASFASILTQTGNIHGLKNVYRGWGILPFPVQFLERDLIWQHGWDWFKYKVTGQIVEQNDSETFYRVELTFETPQRERHTYKADVMADESKTIYLKGSCNSEKESQVTQYIVENLVRI